MKISRRKLITQASLAAPALVLPRFAHAALAGKQPSPGDTIFQGLGALHSGLAFDYATHGRLRVNSGGRFLEATDGTYFPYLGDTGWDMADHPNLTSITNYLENRRAQGFTVVQFMICGLVFAINPNGDQPFTAPFTGSNLNTPNNNWFNFVDSIVSAAAGKGLGVLMMVMWSTNYGVLPCPFLTSMTSTQAGNFGTYIGNRYGASTNVMYCLGGDYTSPPSGTVVTNTNAMGAALKAAVPSSLITVHPGPDGSGNQTNSATYFQSQSWMDFSAAQSGHAHLDNPEAISVLTTGWNASPTKPTINLESSYELGAVTGGGPPWFSAFDTRQQCWWSLMAGGFGATYGLNCVTNFMVPGDTTCGSQPPGIGTNWVNLMGAPVAGGTAIQNIRNLLAARPGTRTPDQTIVTSAGSGGGQLVCCRTAATALVYSGYGNSFTVNMGKQSGSSVNAYWLGAVTGKVIYINTYTNTGTQAFTPPGPAATAGNDWVLILDDASLTFPTPGTV